MDDIYKSYQTGDQFLADFVLFSQESRQKFGITNGSEFWPMDQLYNLLKDREEGGFLLNLGQHAMLGIRVQMKGKSSCEVMYRDPYDPALKTLQIDVRTLKTGNEQLLKIQWFGKFRYLESIGLLPGFTILSKHNYVLKLPEEHIKLIQKHNFLCGDISAFLAIKSKATYNSPL